MKSIGFQFPQDVVYALSTSYDKQSFCKSQVEADLAKLNDDKEFDNEQILDEDEERMEFLKKITEQKQERN